MRKRMIMGLLISLLLLNGCGGKNSSESSVPKDTSAIAGKTYYNTVNEYGSEEHSYVSFNSDGTFQMKDFTKNGFYEMKGSWTFKDKTVTLTIGEKGVTSASTRVLFEVKSENDLILKTAVGGSKPEQTYSVGKSNWNTYDKDDLPAETEAPAEEGGETPTETPASTSAVPCEEIITEYKSYWSNANTKPWNLEVEVKPSNTTDKITYKSNDENVVKVDQEGNVTPVSPGKTTIEITCGKQSLTIKFETR
ncbi:MAG: Ig-like domain-containing protein [Erysipelotrichaceae bacterium]|nr:Ig-like domain-containing protein [Erysipelotrichaceae bacterium]